MRTLAFTILTMSIALTAGQASAQTYGPRFRVSPAPYANAPDSYCLQGRDWGYPGNCQFSSYAQCMATASGTFSYCGINPHYAFALQRRGDYRPRYGAAAKQLTERDGPEMLARIAVMKALNRDGPR